MRVLVISQNWPWINPTAHILLQALLKFENVYVTGWGFPETFETFRELQAAKGPFDVAIVDQWVLQNGNHKHYAHCSARGILDSGLPLILNCMQTDLHASSKDFFQNYVDKCACVISAGTDSHFWPKDFSAKYAAEPWLHPSYVTETPSAIDDRFVLIPHCVSSDEFVSVKYKRPIDISLPGVGYNYRRKARERLSRMAEWKVSVEDPKYQKAIAHFASRYGFYLGENFGLTRLARYLFRRNLSRSKIVLTCGGTVNYPVRKFFEIPASGAVLMGELFTPAKSLGFKHRENCFDLQEAELDELPEKVRWLVSDSNEAMRIAQLGQDMVAEFHTVDTRARQLVELSKHVFNGEFKSMHWQDGRPNFDLNTVGF